MTVDPRLDVILSSTQVAPGVHTVRAFVPTKGDRPPIVRRIAGVLEHGHSLETLQRDFPEEIEGIKKLERVLRLGEVHRDPTIVFETEYGHAVLFRIKI